MGCGSSITNVSNAQSSKVDLSTNKLSKLDGEYEDGAILDSGVDGVVEDNPALEECDNKELEQEIQTNKLKETMDVEEDNHADDDDTIDLSKGSRCSIADIISMDIKKGSEKHNLLKDASVEVFVEEGKKFINELNDISLNLEKMPENFRLACKLRLVYHNARYNVGVKFCKLYLDKIMDEGLFSCLARALKGLHEKWPEAFLEASNPQEVFKPSVSKLSLSSFPRPEMAVASVWVRLVDTVLGTTDLHEGCRIKAAEEGVLEYLLMNVIPAVTKGGYPGAKTVCGKLLLSAISAVYNCSMSTANMPYFEKSDGVNILLKLLGTSNERLNMLVLFTLAYLIDEKNNHLIVSTNKTIDKIIHFLITTNNLVGRRYNGLSNVEIADAITRLAVNDDNKKMIGKRNGLLALVNMFSAAKSDNERISSANALWMLLFDKGNQESFKAIDNAVDMITAHRNSDDKDLKKAISGIIWELETKYELQEKVGIRGESKECKHVMISYNWEQQPVMMKIRDELRSAGYSVWMDVDKIGGSTLEAMALAVENSAVILVAVSRKYKESANCRSEAEYAFQLRKSIVPLMMENNYQPDGWLGFVVGAKFWIDFTNKLQFKEDMSKLVREVGDRGKIGSELIHPTDAVDVGATAENTRQTEEAVSISSWDNGKVREWLCAKNHLDKAIGKSILNKITGKHLISLHKLHQQSPDFFFNSIRTDFGFDDVLDLLAFTDAIHELVESSR